MRAVRVTVPASTANLGPGFDVLGLALGLYNVLEVRAVPEGLRIDVEGEGAERLPADERNIAYQAMLATFERAGRRPDGLRLRLINRIPLVRGLGSSGSTRVAACVAANALAGERLNRDEVLEIATRLEGHPDNVVAAMLGGFVICGRSEDRVQFLSSPVPDALR